MIAALVLSTLLGAQAGTDVRPLADVWPYDAKRLPDGKIQLSYDLSGLKAHASETEAATELDEAALADFAKKMPKELKVVVDQAGASIAVDVTSDREKGPPSVSFAAVPSTRLAASTPIDPGPAARILPAFHPDSPKTLLSFETLLWKARLSNESMLAGIELAVENGTAGLPMAGKAFWPALIQAALARAAATDGDSKEGALMLAEVVGAALKRQHAPLPSQLSKNAPLLSAIEEQAGKWEELPYAQATSLRGSFDLELKRLERRNRALAQPLPDSRAGRAAGLVLLVILERDAKLKAAYEALEKLRDALTGAPAANALTGTRKIAAEMGSAQAALDDFPEFVARTQRDNVALPAVFPLGDSPIEKQLLELGGAQQESARDDVVLQLQEGRLAPENGEGASLLSVMDWAYAGALAPVEKSLPPRTLSRSERERVAQALLSTLPAPSGEVDADAEVANAPEDTRPYGLSVALKVPPVFAVEPATILCARLSFAYQRLEKLLTAWPKLASVTGVMPGGGRRAGANKAEAQKLRRLFRGLELLLTPGAVPMGEDRTAAQVATDFIANWKADPDLAADVRFASPLRGGGQVAVYGVARQEVRIRWDEPPRASVTGAPAGFVVDTNAPERFFVSMPVTGQPSYPGTIPDRTTFRAISDKAGRDPVTVDATAVPANLEGEPR